MKRILCILFAVVLGVLAVFPALAEDYSVIDGKLKTKIKLKKSYAENDVIEGQNPLTGLPSSGEPYTPIMLVLDNAEDAHPHWGISQADILFQVPNAGKGATKLLALFADRYPDNAGGARSGRATMLPLAKAWDAAFAYAGPPAASGANVNLDTLLKKWNFNKSHKSFNLLGNKYKERVSFMESPHNLSCHIKEIHDYLVEENVEFTPHPFIFTDDPLSRGENAIVISLKHYGDSKDHNSNNASASTFAYNADKKAYIRSNSSGEFIDRDTKEGIPFANVIVLRTGFGWQKGYPYLAKHLVGSGVADIFQNGHYIQGAWTRSKDSSRIVFTDETGSELTMQRGKTFIVVTNDVTEVIYY